MRFSEERIEFTNKATYHISSRGGVACVGGGVVGVVGVDGRVGGGGGHGNEGNNDEELHLQMIENMTRITDFPTYSDIGYSGTVWLQ